MEETISKTNLSSLNEKQFEAVISKEKRLLVLAGAGSGKTNTLLQKINYLIDNKQVDASSILAITFTRNAANEMLDRMILSADKSGYYKNVLETKGVSEQEINIERQKLLKKYTWINQITFKTFHSLCHQIMRTDGVHVFDNQFKIVPKQNDSSLEYSNNTAYENESEIIQKVTIKLSENKDYLIRLKRYVLDYLVDKIREDEVNSEFRPEGKFFTTLRGEKVRSKSEQFISDWLFRNNIDYKYERKERIDKSEFHPDFFIPSANIYLEHVSKLSHPTFWKEIELKKGGITCIKTYDKATYNSTVFNKILNEVIKGRISEDIKSATVLNYHEEFSGIKKELRKFYRQVIDIKSAISTSPKISEEIKESAAKSKHERVRLFYEVAMPIIEEYYRYCTNKSYLDFDGLIEYSIKLFNEKSDIKKRYQKRFKYILVDEFQDVNNKQVEFLNHLVNNETQLFCVGDDWQSIYGFRGSEIDYIINFKKHFQNAKLITLNLNYRSSDHIVQASNEIIKNNKFQIQKEVKSVRKGGQKIEVHYSEFEGQSESFIWEKIQYHLQKGVNPDDILILYRRSAMSNDIRDSLKKSGINVQLKTIHGAKGLEAKVVFILGLHSSSGGFPDPWMQDKIYHVIKKTDYNILLEEERRLFYVAVTRAKEHLYLMSKKGSVSDFVKEIPKSLLQNNTGEVTSIEQKITMCKKCDSKLEDHFKYCPECGAPMIDIEEENIKEENHDREKVLQTKDNKEIILECIRDLKFDVGVNYLSKILKGSKTVLNHSNSPEDFTNYGVFSYKTLKVIKEDILELINTDLLTTFSGSYGNTKVCLPNEIDTKEVDLKKQNNHKNEEGNKTKKEGNWIKEKARLKYAKAYEPWSKEEDDSLEMLYCKGLSLNELIVHFKRSRGAILARIEKLDLEQKYS